MGLVTPREPAVGAPRRTGVTGPRAALLAVLAAVLAGCGSGPTTAPPQSSGGAQESPSPSTTRKPAEQEQQEYRYTGYAIGPAGADEATLCGSLVLQSLPPQCGDGVTVQGWDWSGLGADTAGGVSFGEVEVVGRWDATASTLTATRPPAPPAQRSPDPGGERDYTTPCPEPAGGWESLAPTDPARADFGAAYAAVAAVDGYLIAWMDRNPGSARPTYAVLNVRTAGDVAAMEAAARQHWSGPLCVTGGAERSAAELDAIRAEVEAAHPELAPLNLDEWEGRVVGVTWVAPDGLQDELDAAYGEGLVQITEFLEPVG